MSDNEHELSFREMLERAWRAWPRILAFWFFTILATAFVVLFWPRTYASTAQLFLQKGRETVGLDPTANATGKTIALQQSGRDSEIKSAIDVLGSRGVIEPVVDRLSPDVVLGKDHEDEAKRNPVSDSLGRTLKAVVTALRSIDPAGDRERAIVEIEKHLEVQAERKSEVISVTFEADTPALAQKVVAAIVDEYQAIHSELHRTKGSTEFFDQQSARLKQELDVKADALRQAKDRMGLASIERQRDILEQQYGTIRSDVLDTEKRLFSAQATASNLAQQLKARPERISSAEVTKPNSGADMQRQLLYDLQISLEEVRSKFQDNHPQVRFLERQVASAQAELGKQTPRRTESTDDVNPVHSQLTLHYAENDAEIAGLTAKRQKLIAQQQQLLAQIKQQNAYEIEVEQLEREVLVAEKKYLAYAESLEEALVDQAMKAGHISSVSIAQPATLQEKPVSPSKVITVLVGAMLCMIGAMAIAFINIQFDDALTSEHAVREQLQVPVLATLPNRREFARVTF